MYSQAIKKIKKDLKKLNEIKERVSSTTQRGLSHGYSVSLLLVLTEVMIQNYNKGFKKFTQRI